MALFRSKKPIWESEWELLLKKEGIHAKKRENARSNRLEEKVSTYIPKKLDATLVVAFEKALGLVQKQGKPIIEKTYNRTQQEQDYAVRNFAADFRLTQKTGRAFRRRAVQSKTSSVAISCVEGVGLGLLGIGLADIPILMGVIFRAIHQIAMSYGFEIDSDEEQLFSLCIIEAAMARGEAFVQLNQAINTAIDQKQKPMVDMVLQQKNTARSLANELLCMKFIQGIPLVGVIGGLSDITAVKLVSDYGELKYRRKFLSVKRSVAVL